VSLCLWCGEPCPPSKPRQDRRASKPRKFCQDACSRKWWNNRGPRSYGADRPKARGKRYHLYGLTEEDVETLRAAQEYGCAICRRPLEESEVVDHCHETDQVRGLLCSLCNSGLGFFRDDPHLLKMAMYYLTNKGEF